MASSYKCGKLPLTGVQLGFKATPRYTISSCLPLSRGCRNSRRAGYGWSQGAPVPGWQQTWQDSLHTQQRVCLTDAQSAPLSPLLASGSVHSHRTTLALSPVGQEAGAPGCTGPARAPGAGLAGGARGLSVHAATLPGKLRCCFSQPWEGREALPTPCLRTQATQQLLPRGSSGSS